MARDRATRLPLAGVPNPANFSFSNGSKKGIRQELVQVGSCLFGGHCKINEFFPHLFSAFILAMGPGAACRLLKRESEHIYENPY